MHFIHIHVCVLPFTRLVSVFIPYNMQTSAGSDVVVTRPAGAVRVSICDVIGNTK